MDVADPASQQAAMVTCGACVCRNCSVKAGKQQLAEGFCSEHIWTHSGFKGKPVQHVAVIRCCMKSFHCKLEDVPRRLSCHCCQRGQKMDPIQGSSQQVALLVTCSASSSCSQLQLVHPSDSVMMLIETCCARYSYKDCPGHIEPVKACNNSLDQYPGIKLHIVQSQGLHPAGITSKVELFPP